MFISMMKNQLMNFYGHFQDSVKRSALKSDTQNIFGSNKFSIQCHIINRLNNINRFDVKYRQNFLMSQFEFIDSIIFVYN